MKHCRLPGPVLADENITTPRLLNRELISGIISRRGSLLRVDSFATMEN